MSTLHRSIAIMMLTTAAATPSSAQQAAKVTRPQFQQLGWLIGAWRGSGGAYPSFFEEYRLVNDSTIQMRSFSDSTFQVASDSSTIAWRGGAMQSRSARSVYVVTEVTPTSIRFIRQRGTSGHTFTRVSADEWTATLDPATPDGRPTVYAMRRTRKAP